MEGKNVLVEYRGSEDLEQLEKLAAELVRANVSVLVTQGQITVKLGEYYSDIPHVFGISGDPVKPSPVSTLAQPGGNLTGITFLAFELVGKRLEVLKEALPKVSRESVIASPAHPGEQRKVGETRKTAQALGISVLYHQVNTTPDVQTASDAIAKKSADVARLSRPGNEHQPQADCGVAR